jgi:hypothetical protein
VARISCVNRNFWESTVISVVVTDKRLDGITSAYISFSAFYSMVNSLKESQKTWILLLRPAIELRVVTADLGGTRFMVGGWHYRARFGRLRMV